MTNRERFEKFLANEPVDRVPVAFFHHFTAPNEWGKGTTNPEAFEKNVNGHKTALEKFVPDVCKVMNDTLMIMPVDTSFVEKASDLRNICPPDENSRFMKKTVELTKRVLEFYKDLDAPKYVTTFSPIFVLRNSMGDALPSDFAKPTLVQYLEEDPDSVLVALDKIAAATMKMHEILIKECGAEGIYFSVNNQKHYIPDDMYKKYISKYDVMVMDHANTLSKINMLHICGYHGGANNLELFTDVKAAAYNWAVHAEGVSLSKGKKMFGGAPVCGGFEQDKTIYTGSPAQMEKAVYSILDEAGQVGVCIGADCTVPTDIDDDRLNWVRNAAVKYAEEHK